MVGKRPDQEALAAALTTMREAVRRSMGAPLSARHAMQAVAAMDHLSDVAFALRSSLSTQPLAAAADILSFRAGLRRAAPELAPLMDLTSAAARGPHLQVVSVPVPPDAFASLPVADVMVSFYNEGNVPRLMLVQTDGQMLSVQDLLQTAALWWDEALEMPEPSGNSVV